MTDPASSPADIGSALLAGLITLIVAAAATGNWWRSGAASPPGGGAGAEAALLRAEIDRVRRERRSGRARARAELRAEVEVLRRLRAELADEVGQIRSIALWLRARSSAAPGRGNENGNES